ISENSMIPQSILGAILLGLGLGLALSPIQAQVPSPAPPTPTPPAAVPLHLEAVLSTNGVLHKDKNYGTVALQKLDVYTIPTMKKRPVVVFVHGGEWTKGDKAEVAYKPKLFNDAGIVFVSVNYRLAPAAAHPAAVNDVALAARWVVEHIAEYGGDPDTMILMGHSAGCHLVALTTLDPTILPNAKLRANAFRAVVCWSGGTFDLVHKYKTDEKFHAYIRNAFGNDEAAWRAASPITHAKNGAGGPPFLFVTTDPQGDSFRIATKLKEQIAENGGKASTLILENRTHKTANALLGAPDDTTGMALLKYIQSVIP
ncbi:MAG: alpha/beta hydrolase, partial [Gemmataceae bacterium]